MSRYLSLFFVLLIALGAMPVSQAAFISQGSGDRTLDTATNRVWLDVNLTTNCNYGVFTGGGVCNGIDTSAWTFATRTDVEQLWTNAGITLLDTSSYSTTNTSAIEAFQGLFGITGYSFSYNLTNGFVLSGSPLLAQLVVDTANSTSRDYFISGLSPNAAGNIGAYLYQVADLGGSDIPSPSVSWLLLLGLGCLFLGKGTDRRRQSTY